MHVLGESASGEKLRLMLAHRTHVAHVVRFPAQAIVRDTYCQRGIQGSISSEGSIMRVGFLPATVAGEIAGVARHAMHVE